MSLGIVGVVNMYKMPSIFACRIESSVVAITSRSLSIPPSLNIRVRFVLWYAKFQSA